MREGRLAHIEHSSAERQLRYKAGMKTFQLIGEEEAASRQASRCSHEQSAPASRFQEHAQFTQYADVRQSVRSLAMSIMKKRKNLKARGQRQLSAASQASGSETPDFARCAA